MGKYFNLEQETKAICRDSKAVTPSDSTDFTEAFTPRGEAALFIGTGGDVKVIMAGDNSDASTTFKNIPSGTFLPIVVKRVYATGTTASNILAIN